MTVRIFLADGAVMFCEALRLLLETQPNYKVVGCTGDGATAVREIGLLSPDIAILDVYLPGLDGIEVTREIATLEARTHIIILSMCTLTSTVVEALRAGARGYVFKTSLGRDIIEAVQAVAAGQKYLNKGLASSIIEDYVIQDRESHTLPAVDRLSAREREVLQLIIEGCSSAEAAERLLLSVGTVDTYRSRIMRKLDVKDFLGLVRFTVQHGLVRLA
jgi:DNA-binding NarL/FixJ family response regulator